MNDKQTAEGRMTAYYMVRKEKQEYFGERYFAYSWDADKVIQVCIQRGDTKRGKTNAIGIYMISRITMLSNYQAMNYLTPITKHIYETKFNKVVEMLSGKPISHD